MALHKTQSDEQEFFTPPSKLRQPPPPPHLSILPVLIFFPLINQVAIIGRCTAQFLEQFEVFEKIGAQRIRRFDFDGEEALSLLHHKVNLVARAVCPEIEVGLLCKFNI